MHQGPFLLLPPSWNLSEQSYWTLSRLKPEDEIQTIKKPFLELGMPFMLSSKYYFKNTSRRQWTYKEPFLVSSGTWKLHLWITNQGTLPWYDLHSWSLWYNLIEHHRRQEPRTRFKQLWTSSITPWSKDLLPRLSWYTTCNKTLLSTWNPLHLILVDKNSKNSFLDPMNTSYGLHKNQRTLLWCHTRSPQPKSR